MLLPSIFVHLKNLSCTFDHILVSASWKEQSLWTSSSLLSVYCGTCAWSVLFQSGSIFSAPKKWLTPPSFLSPRSLKAQGNESSPGFQLEKSIYQFEWLSAERDLGNILIHLPISCNPFLWSAPVEFGGECISTLSEANFQESLYENIQHFLELKVVSVS